MHFGKHTARLLEPRIHFSCQLNAWACREESETLRFPGMFLSSNATNLQSTSLFVKDSAVAIKGTCSMLLYQLHKYSYVSFPFFFPVNEHTREHNLHPFLFATYIPCICPNSQNEIPIQNIFQLGNIYESEIIFKGLCVVACTSTLLLGVQLTFIFILETFCFTQTVFNWAIRELNTTVGHRTDQFYNSLKLPDNCMAHSQTLSLCAFITHSCDTCREGRFQNKSTPKNEKHS